MSIDEQGRGRRFIRLFRQGLDLRGVRGQEGALPAIMLMLLAAVSLFGDRAFGLALPEIQRHFKLNLRSLLTIFAWIGLVGTLLTGPFAYLGDRWRRTTLSGIGALVTSLGSLVTAFAPTKTALTAVRAFSDQGSVISAPVQVSLISDYYPLEERGRVIAFLSIGRNIGIVLAPLFVGVVGTALGWQAPFAIMGGVGILIALMILRLREPARGYYERIASGADEEVALREQEPPSWGESWRAAWGVRTLRRIGYASALISTAIIGVAIYLPLYYSRVFGLTLLQRGAIAAAGAAFGIVALIAGGPILSRLLARRPGRLVTVTGLLFLVYAAAILGMVLSRNLGMALALNFVGEMAFAVIYAGLFTIASAVIPPRLRGLGLSTISYWSIPGFFVFPIIGSLADRYGIRAGIALLPPLLMMGAAIFISAAQFVEFDIRSATAAAMAQEMWRRAKREGRAKMLLIRNLDVHYDKVQVLFDLSLDVQQGELLAVLGTNGAGKSTLLRAISGVQPATGGAIVFDGRDITHVPPHENARYGVVHVPGGRGVFPSLTVGENLLLSGWLYGQEQKHRDELEQVFRYFPVLRARLDQQAATLSGGEQQMLVLAQAFLSRPRLLMIDELTLGLGPAVVEQLLGIVRAIHERGTTIILVEQSVNVALTVATRAVFMEKGEIRFDGPAADLLQRPELLRAVFLRSSAGALGVAAPRRPSGEPPVVLEVQHLSKRYGGVTAVDDLSFGLQEGRVLGLIGPNGAGKTSALEIISGFVMPDAGRVFYDGRDITEETPEARAHLGVVRRFQDAGLFPSLTVGETLAVALERQFEVRSVVLEGLGAPQARVAEARVRRRVDRLIELMGLEDSRDKFISELSTGTRRVVDLACALAAEPKVLLLDEPSTGMAQREAEGLAPLLRRVRDEAGCSILIIEHDMPLIAAVSDELLAMHLGKAVVRGSPEAVLEDERVVQAYLGTSEEVIARAGARE
jgi:ABC-type branched-subunit amino acid transport system ATPase component/predicted MFS family arabinose efflux permease